MEDPEDFAGDRDFILDYKLTGQDVNCGLLLDQGEEENFFMLMIQPPKQYDPEDILPVSIYSLWMFPVLCTVFPWTLPRD